MVEVAECHVSPMRHKTSRVAREEPVAGSDNLVARQAWAGQRAQHRRKLLIRKVTESIGAVAIGSGPGVRERVVAEVRPGR